MLPQPKHQLFLHYKQRIQGLCLQSLSFPYLNSHVSLLPAYIPRQHPAHSTAVPLPRPHPARPGRCKALTDTTQAQPQLSLFVSRPKHNHPGLRLLLHRLLPPPTTRPLPGAHHGHVAFVLLLFLLGHSGDAAPAHVVIHDPHPEGGHTATISGAPARGPQAAPG